MGNVLPSWTGPKPSKACSYFGGCPPTTPATTVNKVCASGMKAVALAAQSIRLGEIDVAVAGGFESMSNSPHCIPALRSGVKYGSAEVVDLMQHDGAYEPFRKYEGRVNGYVWRTLCKEVQHFSC